MDYKEQPPSSPYTTGRGHVTVLPDIEYNGPHARIVPRQTERYQRLRQLGAGGMGEVSLVRDHDIGRSVALKQLMPRAHDPAGLARFIEEIRVIGRLEHPNIIPIHDVGVDDQGRFFFVMKYIDGETLESIIKKLAAGEPDYHARFPLERRVEIFCGLLRALQFAHANGIVHRDIKPANVMIGRYGEVVLMDWGIAKQVNDPERPIRSARPEDETSVLRSQDFARLFATEHGALLGTPAYMSPEQASGRNNLVDTRSDIYSATVLLHELLSLRHYLAGINTVNAMLFAVIAESPTSFTLAARKHPRQPALPAELLHFIVKGLAKNPAARYQNVEEMLNRLQDMQIGCVRVQCPTTLAKRMVRETGRWIDRWPRLTPLVFFSVTLLLLFCLVTTVRFLLR